MSDPDLEKLFEELLQERFRQEFDGARFATPYMQRVKQWWIEDQGLERVETFDFVFRRLEPFLPPSRASLTCLDIGCGTAASVVALASRGIPCIGLEYDPVGSDFKLAKLRCRIAHAPSDLVRGTALALPFPEGTFDLCLSTAVVEHIENFETHISEMARVLKRGGVAYVYTRNRIWPYDSHTRSYFVQWLGHKALELYWNIRPGFGRWRRLNLWPVTSFRLKRVLLRAGFEILFDVGDEFLSRSTGSFSFKHRLIRACMRVRLPLEVLHQGCVFVLRKL